MKKLSLDAVSDIVEEVLEGKREKLDTALNADKPSDERIERLEQEVDLLEQIVELLQEYLALD